MYKFSFNQISDHLILFKQTAQWRDRQDQVAEAERLGLPPPVFSPDRRLKRPAAPSAAQAAPDADDAADVVDVDAPPAGNLRVSASLFGKRARTVSTVSLVNLT